MTAASNDDDNGGFFQVQQTRNNKARRIYISNLPSLNSDDDEIKRKLVDFINQQHDFRVVETNVTFLKQGTAALVACRDINKAISILHNAEFEGNKLVVERERKKRPANKTNKHSSSFGGSGWNRPKKASPTTTTQEKKETSKNKVVKTTEQQDSKQMFDSELELSQHLASIDVKSELEAATRDPSNGNVVNTVIASASAMSSSDNPVNGDALSPEKPTTKDDSASNDFAALSKRPLSELLADYGEQDLDFDKVVVTTPVQPTKSETTKTKRQDYNNRLTLAGKAPIHVEVTSFGYIHGVPSTKDGWSHSNPFPPLDCRDLPQVPQYMARKDGFSPAVKRALLNARDVNDESKRHDRVKQYANELGKDMFNAVYEAISVGNHGHASPLRMSVYVGSETGRHRSVVVCELAATALRKLLRSNDGNRIVQPVSVGTRHRDIERRSSQQRDER